MGEGQPIPISHIQLELGQAVVISVRQPDLGTRHPDLFEKLRTVVRHGTNSAILALGGGPNEDYDFDVDYGKDVAKLGEQLHKAGYPVEVVEREVRQTLIYEPHRNIDYRSAQDLTGFFVDRLSYSPKNLDPI